MNLDDYILGRHITTDPASPYYDGPDEEPEDDVVEEECYEEEDSE